MIDPTTRELQAFYNRMVARRDVKRHLILKTLKPSLRLLANAVVWARYLGFLLVAPVLVLVGTKSHFGVVVLFACVAAMALVGSHIGSSWTDRRFFSQPYSGPLQIQVGVVESEETRSTSGGEYTVSVVRWREAYLVQPDGTCQSTPPLRRLHTMVDLGLPIGAALRRVVSGSAVLADVPAELRLPGSAFTVGFSVTLPVPKSQASSASALVPASLCAGRSEFFARAEQEFRAQDFCVLSMDLDDFEAYNDRHGTAAGDWRLVQAAREMRQGLGPEANLGHCGGDEFSATMRVPLQEARERAERVRCLLAESMLGPGNLTISVGVAGSSESTASLAELVRRADAALSLAKQAGKNRVELG